MKKRIALFSPGPTNLTPAVLQSFQQELIHHRGKAFRSLYPSLCNKLKTVFQTSAGETLVLTGSGTLGLDAGLASLFVKKDKVIVISNGYFGERLSMMAKKYGLNVVEMVQEWSQPFVLSKVEKLLQENTDAKALLVVYSETSTGTKQDLQGLGKLVKSYSMLFMVDAISGLLFNDFYFDDWHVDYAVSSSQKGFGLPPGLAFVALSPLALSKLHDQNLNYYISLKDNLEVRNTTGSTPSTPAIHMMQALDVAIDEILAKGVVAYQKRAKSILRKLKKELIPLGFVPLCKQKDQTYGVLGLYTPSGVTSSALQDYLLEHHQVYIEKGIAKFANKMIRIGVMSQVSDKEVKALITGIKEYIYEFNHQE